ncbi:hypothetical protein BDZ97DRAFT_1760028 [Flammula alnicola]|nr:hypothetical protein BDZ97DRAFT_1760028 [Flammula alnicola]
MTFYMCSLWSVAWKHREHKTQLSSNAQSLRDLVRQAFHLLEEMATRFAGHQWIFLSRPSESYRRLIFTEQDMGWHLRDTTGQKHLRVLTHERDVKFRYDLCACNGDEDIFARFWHDLESELRRSLRLEGGHREKKNAERSDVVEVVDCRHRAVNGLREVVNPAIEV